MKSAIYPTLLFGLLASIQLTAAPVPAKKAEAFVNSIGVNVHLGYDNAGGAYTNFPMIKQRLQEIGIRHYRDGLENPKIKNHVKRFHSELSAEGIRGTFIASTRLSIEDVIASANLMADAIEAIEGQNEILNIYVKWDDKKRDDARKHQKALFRALNADPKWKDTPILGPTCVGLKAYTDLGDLSAYMDFGNVHPYPLGHPPTGEKSGFHEELKAGVLVSGRKKLFATETGYTTGTSDTGNQRVSPAAAAKYAPRLYLENFNRGILCSFWYEFCDQGTNGSQEATFGIITKSHEYKPQGSAIRNLITLLKEATFNPAKKIWETKPFTPGKLNYTLTGGTKDIHSTLLQKSDGRFYLCLWQEISSYDIRNNVEKNIVNPDVPVTLELATPMASAMAYRPTSGTEGKTLEITENIISLSVPDEVLMIELTPPK